MLTKVCGMRDAANIRAVESLGIGIMGFIFCAKSPRSVLEKPEYLPVRCRRAGVFVDAGLPDIVARVRDFGLDYVQLHGKESPAYVRALRDGLSAAGFPQVRIIRMVSVGSREDAAGAAEWESLADLLLFETPSPAHGGSGMRFDWDMLGAYDGPLPFLIAGGIGPEDAGAVRSFRHPSFLGVDLNSRFETAPGVKDSGRLKRFLEELK